MSLENIAVGDERRWDDSIFSRSAASLSQASPREIWDAVG
jgi:hypothetical protein